MARNDRKLLVVEDDPGLQTQLKWCFDDWKVVIAPDRRSALEELSKHPYPVMTLDLGLPPDEGGTSEGFAALEEIVREYPHTKVIVVTGNNERENALRAVALGAYDFFYKPIDSELLGFIVNRAYRLHELEEENQRLHTRQHKAALEGVVAASPEMMAVCRTIEKVAPADATVLVLGESGTGKELVARALHNYSPRNEGPFVAINCAAIPENMLEAVLFGHEKGAFTGAHQARAGKFEQAQGGTLLLDEISEMALGLQAKLLRVLQEREVERIGGKRPIALDVRVIATSNRNLREEVRAGRFREDLFYRLNVFPLRLIPLRERPDDILAIADALLERLTPAGRPRLRLDDAARRRLLSHAWPGNVRELENVLQRAAILAQGERIGSDDIHFDTELEPEPAVPEPAVPEAGQGPTGLGQDLRSREHQLILDALARHRSRKEAAAALGISPRTLRYKLARMREAGIEIPR